MSMIKDSDRKPKATFAMSALHRLSLIVLPLILTVFATGADRPNIEAAQRALQERYQKFLQTAQANGIDLGGSPPAALSFPSLKDGTPAGEYPEDCFYEADLIIPETGGIDQDVAYNLIANLIDNLNWWIPFEHFVAPSMVARIDSLNYASNIDPWPQSFEVAPPNFDGLSYTRAFEVAVDKINELRHPYIFLATASSSGDMETGPYQKDGSTIDAGLLTCAEMRSATEQSWADPEGNGPLPFGVLGRAELARLQNIESTDYYDGYLRTVAGRHVGAFAPYGSGSFTVFERQLDYALLLALYGGSPWIPWDATNVSLSGTSAPYDHYQRWHTADSGAIAPALYMGAVIGDYPTATMTPACPSSPGTNRFGWAIEKVAVLSPDYEHNVTEYYRDCSKCECAGSDGGTCVQGHVSVKMGSLNVEIGLGDDAHESVGSISLRERYTSPNLAHPSSLRWNLNAGATVVRGSDPENTIRQVKSTQGLVDILETVPFRNYEMRFYDATAVGVASPTTGIFGTTGSPYKTVTIENPDAALWSLIGVTNATPFPNSFLIVPSHGLPPASAENSGLYYARITSSTGVLPVANTLGQLKATQVYVVYSHPSYPNALILAYETSPGNYSLDYFISADTAATLTVSSPFPYNRLKITESGGAHVKSSTYQYDYIEATETLSWTLAQSIDGTLFRTDRKTLVEDFNTSTGVYLLNSTEWIEDTQQEIVSKKSTVRSIYPWNDYSSNWTGIQGETISEVIDPDDAALTTSHAYYDNQAVDGANYGRLKEVVRADGAWERYEYDASGRIFRLYRSYLGSAPSSGYAENEVVDYAYDQAVNIPGGATGIMSTTITRLDNQEVTRSFRIVSADTANALNREITIQARDTGASWDASGNLWTEQWIHAAGEFNGRIARELRPDGTASIYEYARDAQTGHETTAVASGVPDSAPAVITRGTRVITEMNDKGGLVSLTTYDIGTSTTMIASEVTLVSDEFGRALEVSYLDGTTFSRAYDCCGLVAQIDREGIATSYTRDHADRVLTSTRAGITIKNDYDVLGRVRSVQRYPAGQPANAVTLSESAYDVAGQVVSMIDRGRETTFAETPDATQRLTARLTKLPFDPAWPVADRGEITEVTWADGRAASQTGNATAPSSFAYSTATLPEATSLGYSGGTIFRVVTKTKLDSSGAATPEAIATFIDPLGRTVKTVHADGAAAYQVYNDVGQLTREVDPDGVQMLYEFDELGQPSVTALDMDRDGQIDYAGTDRITRTTREVTTLSDGGPNYGVNRATSEVWDIDNTDAPRVLSVVDSSVDGLRAWQAYNSQTTSSVTSYGPAQGARTETTTFPDGTALVRTYQDGRLVGESRLDSAQQAVTASTLGYDSHGRTETVTDLLGRTTSFTYFDDDQIQTNTTPDLDSSVSGPGYDPQTTTYRYDAAGRVDKVTQPDGSETNTSYWPTGQVKRTWGGRVYPQEYSYDAQSRLKTLTTWQDFAGQSGQAVTTWNYDPQRGWLSNKRYNDNEGPDYNYWPSGRLETREWQRGVVTTYGYTNAGEVTSITYSDSTPSVTQTYDRLGRPHVTTDAAGVLTRSYDPTSLLLSGESYSGAGLLTGRSLGRSYDSLNRPNGATTDFGYSVAYDYDSAGRLFTVTQGIHSAQYGYKSGVGSVETTTVKRSGIEVLLHERTTDSLERISQVRSSAGANIVAQRDYIYNDANQRIRATREDNAYWAYGYDSLGQVTSGALHKPNETIMPGLNFSWNFDDIGNRETATTNGQISTYSANLLNQYSQRTVPGVVDVAGDAASDATVTVTFPASSGSVFATERSGESFFKQLLVGNSAAPQFVELKVTGVKNLVGPNDEDAVTEEVRRALVPQNPEVHVHDDDGNLVQDARWTYTWDGENRLVGMQTTTTAASAGAPNLKLELAYDTQGRRIEKKVSNWSGSTWELAKRTLFIYDGWNLISEFDAMSTPTLTRSYVWGLDLAGTMQGAGGVGGLLFATLHTSQITSHTASYDGNGNVIAYVGMATGAKSATYEYSAFGETLIADGPMQDAFPFRFSTKHRDSETGLVYFNYRYYDPNPGRFLSRDPIEEEGGDNLNGFVDNDPISNVDVLGLAGYFFDGTGNNRKSGSNVLILHDVYGGLRYYYRGVGSSVGTRAVGGLTGAGGINRLEAAYRDFIRAVDSGDRYVDIVGFSRGAALAREFANLLNERGYDPKYGGKLKHKLRAGTSKPPRECEFVIRFVGLFDSVGSFGVPGNDINIGIRMDLPAAVGNAAQATAQNERRYLFPLTPLGDREGFGERGFPGDHSDIGRGHGKDTNDLSRAPLEYIWNQGRAAGAPFGPLPQNTPTGNTMPHDLSRKFPHNLFPKRPR